MRHTLPRRVRGFTLVEVLVALFIMAVMAVAAWQGVDGMVRTRDASQTRLEQTLRLGTVMAQWEQDLAAIQDTGVVPPLSFDGAALRLTRRSETGVQLVIWSLRPSNETGVGATLLRWAGPPVTGAAKLAESWLQAQQFQGVERGQLATLSGITQWQVYYYRGNGWSNAQSSGNAAAPPAGGGGLAGGTLPQGVRLVLSFEPGGSLNATLAGVLTRDVALQSP